VALSTRFKCPIYTYESILESAGVFIEDNEIIGEETEAQEEKTSVTLRQNPDDYSGLSTSELERLLHKALDEEDYEKAASIRDEMSKR
jgi:protein-arginine kinase activator protein McsA